MAFLSRPRLTQPGVHRTSRRAGAAAAIALHAVTLAAVLTYEPARSALIGAAPIMVELFTPPKPPEPRLAPPTELPKPRPVAKVLQPPEPVEPPPLITAPAQAPSAAVVAPRPRSPSAPVAEAVAAISAAPVTTTPPVFNADYLENPPPAYPPLSRRMREQGRVMLRVLVNPSGTADDVQIRTSSGITRLDEAAQETVKRWKFVPAKRGSEAVSAWVLIPISFRLEG